MVEDVALRADAVTGRPRILPRGRVVLALVVAALLSAVAMSLVFPMLKPQEPVAAPSTDPGLIHVHGLGVDPADGAVYAASHGGLFRLPDDVSGTAVRVADRWQDTMGFTVVGPNRFLASGHPDLREDKPVLLGLVESSDAGRTWQPLSLEGRSDFHGLQVVGARLFGYDSTAGRLLVTRDRQRWESRAKGDLTALAVKPTGDGRVLLAAGSDGRLRRSDDDGRSFYAVPGGPRVTSLSWPGSGPVYGVTLKGALVTSADDGLTWQQRGAVDGPAEALVAADSSTLYVATESGIYMPSDGGITFKLRYET